MSRILAEYLNGRDYFHLAERCLRFERSLTTGELKSAIGSCPHYFPTAQLQLRTLRCFKANFSGAAETLSTIIGGHKTNRPANATAGQSNERAGSGGVVLRS